ncbi:hypothetical protein GCWU000324_02350 [Kingella oralis ATCC 51147]|uniref:Uncharacterized protein n=1 Tax=Kingella oralis ATCC 51147 TaxID=629741 RepID=C4GJX6_9NEIS|nr:hypothetical protein GCWU000324_02350 [Kingella oralis ATCC 51147]
MFRPFLRAKRSGLHILYKLTAFCARPNISGCLLFLVFQCVIL